MSKQSKKQDISLFYKSIDFLTLKIKEKNLNISEIEEKLYLPQNSFDVYQWVKQKIDILYKFFLVFQWLVFWNKKKIYDLYDQDLNKLWQLTLKNENIKNIPKNVIDSLELSSLFFSSYRSSLYDILKYFKISSNEQWVVKRIDYCVDFKWLEVFQFTEKYLKEIHKKNKEYIWLTWLDKKKLNEWHTELNYWKVTTYLRYFTEKNTLRIYDKVLDCVDNDLKRKVNWENPYKKYIDSDLPILRIEIQKKSQSLKHLKNNSLNFLIENIDSLFWDYLKRYFEEKFFDLDFDYNSINWKQLHLAKQEKDKRIWHIYKMARAYLKSIQQIEWEKQLHRFIYDEYPELDNIKMFDLLDPFEIQDYYSWINETLSPDILY